LGHVLQLRPDLPDDPASPGDADPGALEAALVERARGGDVEAWSRLYQDHFDRLHRHVAYLVGEAHATEDIVQETFAHAVVGLRSYKGDATLLTWLKGIAHNLVRRHWRSHARSARALDRLERSAHGLPVDPENVYLRQRHAEVLLGVLDTLPAPLREAFVACDLRELPPAEAAAELGISLNNLRVRATRARARIRDALARLGWVPAAPEKGTGP
jgi:RNA polymerase sigma-70 factor (ECF subfamily)